MNRTIVSVSMLSILVAGCASSSSMGAPTASPEAAWANPPRPSWARTFGAARTATKEGASAAAPDSVAAAPAPGDFVVYKFTGSFRREAITLTERVVARDDAGLVLDITLEEGNEKTAMRARFTDTRGSGGELVDAALLDGGAHTALDVASFEAIVGRATLAADQNEEMLGSEETNLQVVGGELPCRASSYRVKIGGRQATLRTFESEAFAWGDLGGDIVTAEGEVLYRAEIVAMGGADVAERELAVGTYGE